MSNKTETNELYQLICAMQDEKGKVSALSRDALRLLELAEAFESGKAKDANLVDAIKRCLNPHKDYLKNRGTAFGS